MRIEQLKVLVVDRADEILDIAIGREIDAIVHATPKTRQTVLLSASSPPRLIKLAHQYLRDPDLFGISAEEFESGAPSTMPIAAMVNIYFGAGKGNGVTPRDLVGALINEGGATREKIGTIKIKQNFSLVSVPADQAAGLVSRLRASRIKGRKVKIRLERF